MGNLKEGSWQSVQSSGTAFQTRSRRQGPELLPDGNL